MAVQQTERELSPRRLIIVFQARHEDRAQIRMEVRKISPERAGEISFTEYEDEIFAELEGHGGAENAFVVIGNADGNGGVLAERIKNIQPQATVVMYTSMPPTIKPPHVDAFIKKELKPSHMKAKLRQQLLPEKLRKNPHFLDQPPMKITSEEGETEIPLPPKPMDEGPERLEHPDHIASLLCIIRPKSTLDDLMKCFRVLSTEPPSMD